MGLLSFFQRRDPAEGRTSAEDTVAQARVVARRRLIGAVVLVAAGVIGFPLVFESQPRPVASDIAIDIPRKDAGAPVVVPPARKAATPAPAAASEPGVVAPQEAPARVAEGASASRPVAAPAPAPAPAPVASARKSEPPEFVADAHRAQALLDGKAATKPVSSVKDASAAADHDAASDPAKAAGRFVVQVGAFADAAAAREMRGKIEKLGLKSYTQKVDTPSGSRIRVRAGPFASRDEADKARDKAHAAGMSNAVVLTL